MAPPAILETSVTLSATPAGDETHKTVPVTQVEPRRDEDEDDSTIRTVDELVRRRARANPDGVIVSYPSSGIDYVDYTMKQLDVYAFRVAKHYQTYLPTRTSSAEKPLTVALLGRSNFDYLVTLLALTKLGHTTLFLSTRISQEATDNLICVTGAEYFIVEERYLDVADAAQRTLGLKGVVTIPGPSAYDFPIEVHADTRMDYQLDPAIETNNRIYIIHSSGTTGLPKPIYQTQRGCVANYVFSPRMRAFITLPLYHNHGICNLFRAIYCGKPLHLYNADLPLTHDYLTRIMRTHQFEIFYGVPYALKLLAESDEGMDVLRNLKITMFGGSACPDDLGNALVKSGVNLIGHYGSTETGQLLTSLRPPGDNDWNYLRERDELSPFLRWIPRGPNLFECSVLPGWPAMVASNMPDGSYATKDLFEPHPTLPRAWKYVARRDDTIKLINGEMFNPVSTEGAIRSSKDVAEAVIFGLGRDMAGILVFAAASLAGKTREEMLDAVWPVVEAANRNVEAYGRISRDMIVLLPPGVECPKTDKGSIIRQAIYRKFAKEIDEAYDRSDSASAEVKKMTLDELKSFIRDKVLAMLQTTRDVEPFDDSTDFFLLGVDSLQSIQLRSDIIRTVDVGDAKLRQTVAFDHPSVDQLATYLFSLTSENGMQAEQPVEVEMRALIDRYSQKGRRAAAAEEAAPPRSSVLVTGVTGSLGAHIVAKLAADPTVETIYCLARARSDADAQSRVRSSLRARKLYNTMSPAQRHKIVALAADLADPKLGLPEETYDAVKKDLRTVIHSAWAVNFNMRLSSFESGNIAGVAHLMDLCRAAGTASDSGDRDPASFNFCSSVSTVTRCPVSPIPERVPELEWAQTMGYAQSKSVVENLCSEEAGRHASEKPVTTRVLRIGQIIADSRNGVWNDTEAIPLMLQSAVTIGALPKLRETPAWLPVDTVAQAVLDLSLSEEAGHLVANVVNPRSFDWTSDLLPALRAAGLEFDELEPKEWVQRLRESDTDPVANPPIKLVDFFATKYDKTEFATPKAFATETACRYSSALASAPVLDRDHVTKFIKHFQANSWAAAAGKGTALSTNPGKTVILVEGTDAAAAAAETPVVAASISSFQQLPYIDGDSLRSRQSATNVGQSLDDAEHAQWVRRVGDQVRLTLTELGYDAVVLKSSRLSEGHRESLRSVVELEDAARLVVLALQTPDSPALEKGDDGNVIPLTVGGSLESTLKEAKWALESLGV